MLAALFNPIRQCQILVVITLLLSSGCYPDWPEPTSTAVVHGKITFDGSPLKRALVVFMPKVLRNDADEVLPLAYGATDGKGKFQLAYSDGTQELKAGNYIVIVSKSRGNSDAWNASVLADDLSPNATLRDDELIPAQYNHNSKLTYELIGSPSIVRPVFELSSITEEIEFELNIIDKSKRP